MSSEEEYSSDEREEEEEVYEEEECIYEEDEGEEEEGEESEEGEGVMFSATNKASAPAKSLKSLQQTASQNGKSMSNSAAKFDKALIGQTSSQSRFGELTLTDIMNSAINTDNTTRSAPSQSVKNPLASLRQSPSSNQRTTAPPSSPAVYHASSFSQHHKEFIMEEAPWKTEVLRISPSSYGSIQERRRVSQTMISGVLNNYIKFPNCTFFWQGSYSQFDSDANSRLCGLGESIRYSTCPHVEDQEVERIVYDIYKKAPRYTIDKIELVSYTNRCDKPVVVRCASHDYLNRHFASSNGKEGLFLLPPNSTAVMKKPVTIYCIRKLLRGAVAQRQLLVEKLSPVDILKTQTKEDVKKKKLTWILVPSEMLENEGMYKYPGAREIATSFGKKAKAQGYDYYDNRYLLSFLYNQGSKHGLFGGKSLEAFWTQNEPQYIKEGSVKKKTKKYYLGFEPSVVGTGLEYFHQYVKESRDVSPIDLSELQLEIFPETTEAFSDLKGTEYAYSGKLSSGIEQDFVSSGAIEIARHRTILVELNISLVPSILQREMLAAAAAAPKAEYAMPSSDNKGINMDRVGTLL